MTTVYKLSNHIIKYIHMTDDYVTEFSFDRRNDINKLDAWIWENVPAILVDTFRQVVNGTLYGKPTHPDQLVHHLPGVGQIVRHPVNDSIGALMDIVISLNDTYHWTREAIADWIETLDEVPKFEVKHESQFFKTPSLVTIQRILPC